MTLDQKNKIARYQKENQKVLPGQIVFAGSSLMEMFPIHKLVEERKDPVIIYNRGVGGFVMDDFIQEMDVCVTDLKPKKVFINIGTNDLSNKDVTVEQLMEQYDAALMLIEQHIPEVQIYLMAYYPINYEAATQEMKKCLKIRTNEKINLANQGVLKLARRRGHKYIDVNRNLKDEKGRLKQEYTIEGMHIKEEGYRAILDELMAYVLE